MKTTTSNHTTKNPFRAGSLSSAALITLTAFAIAGTAQTSADTHTWTGATDGDWNDVGNWDIGIPAANGDGLIFSGTSNTATNNDLGCDRYRGHPVQQHHRRGELQSRRQ